MIGHLYTIVNLTNGKEYIGKTYDSIDRRFKQHISKAKSGSNSPIHKAFRKYGVDNFKIYLLDNYPESILEQEEVKAIQLYETFTNGYNATLGGDGRRYINDNLIITEYAKTPVLAKISRNLNIDIKTIKKALQANNIEVLSHKEIVSKVLPDLRPILLVEQNIVFDNIILCAEYLINSGISKTSQTRTKESIYRVCKGLRKSYLKYAFKYL